MDASSRPSRVRWASLSVSQRRNYTSSVVQAITSIAEIRVRRAARLPEPRLVPALATSRHQTAAQSDAISALDRFPGSVQIASGGSR